MDLVKIEMYACGQRSGAEVFEEVYIKQDSYDLMKEEIDELTYWVGDLDGKHSEVEADITIIQYKNNELIDLNFEDYFDDNYRLDDIVGEVFYGFTVDYDKEQKEIKEYIDSLDNYVKREYYIRKSQLKRIDDFVFELRKEDCKKEKE